MLKTKDEAVTRSGVGVIVGRFQVSELTQGHKELIDSVFNRHQKVICVIGLSPLRTTKNNPLDFESRRKMLNEQYSNLHVIYLNDNPSDKEWSKKLDNLISNNIPPETSSVYLYGSRDSFIKSYFGRFETKELIQSSYISGSNVRKDLAYASEDSASFRRGVIYATQNQYDTAFPAVDVAIMHNNGSQLNVLLGKKDNEKRYCFIGGFSDPRISYPNGNFFEENAKREAKEETGLDIDNLEYIDNFLVDDWRYRNEKSKIVSILFKANYTTGTPEPNDDISELKWFNIRNFINSDFMENNLINTHHPLMKALMKSVAI
jgi:bifunctional NMN adenylyltransferase/nudix hydrolase